MEAKGKQKGSKREAKRKQKGEEMVSEKKKQAMLDVYFLSELAIKKDEVNPSLYYKRKEELKRIQKQVEKG